MRTCFRCGNFYESTSFEFIHVTSQQKQRAIAGLGGTTENLGPSSYGGRGGHLPSSVFVGHRGVRFRASDRHGGPQSEVSSGYRLHTELHPRWSVPFARERVAFRESIHKGPSSREARASVSRRNKTLSEGIWLVSARVSSR